MSASQGSTAAETVVTRLTPAIPAAIATIAVHGPRAVEIVHQLVKHKRTTEEAFSLGRVRYGLWNPPKGDEAAEQVVVCRTELQTVEIHCHGGNAVCQMILSDLVRAGCKSVAANEFPTEFDCPYKREAAIDLQSAVTDRTAAILLDQLNGALSEAMRRIRDRSQSEGTDTVRAEVQELLQWSDLGMHLVEPWRVVLAGPPNVGKSSLMNAIVGNARAIVHSEPGTTRDWVEELTAVDGWPIALTDTAGLRESTDAIESEGIRRARQQVAVADLVIFVVDATIGWTDTHEQLRASTLGKKSLTVWNKVDLNLELASAPTCPPGAFCTSANDGRGLVELLSAISKSLVPDVPPAGSAIPFRLHHIQELQAILS